MPYAQLGDDTRIYHERDMDLTSCHPDTGHANLLEYPADAVRIVTGFLPDHLGAARRRRTAD
jgi:hypothetical protein